MSDDNRSLFHAFRTGDPNAVHAAIEAGADLIGATFAKVTTGRVSLDGVDLSNAEFDECLLSGVSFRGANLDGAFIHGSTWVECDLSGANLEGASLEGCVFKQCDLTGATLAESELKGVEFSDCTLADLSLDDATWESITVSGGTFSKVRGEAELSGVVIRDAEISEFDTSAMTISASTTNVSPTPDGFSPLSGRRTRIG